MYIYKLSSGIVVQYNDQFFQISETNWDGYINRKNLFAAITEELKNLFPDPKLQSLVISDALAPVGSQEIWASGVTYFRSRDARMEESKKAGGGSFYEKVYDAERPELFYKSPAYNVVGSGQEVRIRSDSRWNVPEPELTLFICSEGTIEGYTIGNDMSSRDIEGENPLYLPQAKCYYGSAAIGPCLYVSETPIDPSTIIQMAILRGSEMVFNDNIAIDRMKRTHPELATYLMMEMRFPSGVYLMTGTGIIPPDSFTLKSGDVVIITITGIGTLTNIIA